MEPALKQLLLKDGLVLGPEIGKGSFGTVFRCTDVKTQISYAVKKVDLRVLRMQPHFVLERLKRECSVLEKLSHPSVVRLFKTIEAEDAILMVMEMVLGMELFEMIIAVSGLNESEACAVFIQIASALAYMHDQGVVHRDIKPENILIQGSTGDPAELSQSAIFKDAFQHLKPRVKLIDFGLSKVLGTDKGGSVAKSLVGTPRYVAPEIVAIGERMRNRNRELASESSYMPERLSYTEKVDCYSAGVLLHVMLSACFPQFGRDNEVIFTDPRIAKASSGAKDLIAKLMAPYPETRITMADALAHPWVRKHHPKAAQAALQIAGITKRSSGFGSHSMETTNLFPPTAVPSASSSTSPFSPSSQPSSTTTAGMGFLGESATFTGFTGGETPPAEELDEQESMESMVVDTAFAKEHNLGRDETDGRSRRPSETGNLSGMKRQITTSSIHATDAMPNQSLSSQKTGSKSSSIEVINLPGAAKGVWGPFRQATDSEGITRENSASTDTTQEPIESMFQTSNKLDGGAIVPRMIGQQGGDNEFLSVQNNEGMVNPELLLQLQQNIAQCFRQSFEVFKNDDVVSPGIVSSAVASRELLSASETILKKLEQTSLSVLDLLPDMRIAVEEGEFGMAVTCFDTIKEWIRTIQVESQDLLKANVKVIAAVNNTLQLARRRHRVRLATKAGYRVTDALALEEQLSKPPLNPSSKSGGTGASGGAVEAAEAGERESTKALKRKEMEEVLEERRQGSADCTSAEEAIEALKNQRKLAKERRESMKAAVSSSSASVDSNSPSKLDASTNHEMAMVPANMDTGEFVVIDGDYELEPISKALTMLQQIDRLLQKHASFWSHMEVVVDVLMQRANHVESMVNYTRNPRLRGRFIERVEAYSEMWTHITQMCQQFHRKANHLEGVKLYQFLTEA